VTKGGRKKEQRQYRCNKPGSGLTKSKNEGTLRRFGSSYEKGETSPSSKE